MIYTLKNQIKNFPWGSRTAIRDYFDIDNPTFEYQAELWIGAHPSASSSISQAGFDITLCDAIAKDPEYWLGHLKKRFSSLPFLMKILAAEEPLSIQVHPSKTAAEIGFARENEQGIPLNAANRNYKDTNHKPELVYALTPYLAMNGFREYEQIVANFDALELSTINEFFKPFKQKPNSSTLATFFSALLVLEGKYKEQAINELLTSIAMRGNQLLSNQVSSLITHLHKLYPDDIGLFAPILLNVIELQPGQAMFLYAETPHAYIRGLGIEVMANSDNVLRAGLTPKHIDIQQLVENTNFEPIKYAELLFEGVTEGVTEGWRRSFNVPVDDFSVDILNNIKIIFIVTSVEIILCIEGNISFSYDNEVLTIGKGESVIIPDSMDKYEIECEGVAVRVYC